MKNTRSKKLNKAVHTICDFNAVKLTRTNNETSTIGDTDTTVTFTILTTTINTSHVAKG